MRVERLLACLLLACAFLAPRAAAQAPGAPAPPVAVDLQVRLKDIPLVEIDGHMYVRNGGERLVPAEVWLAGLRSAQEEQRRHGFLFVLFNITKPWGVAWVAVGFLGQALFTVRMLLQWWASERARRSVIPVAFWWGSLFGGLLLFVYFCWRKDIVGIVGQSTGLFVYARNLILIHRRAASPAPGAASARAAT